MAYVSFYGSIAPAACIKKTAHRQQPSAVHLNVGNLKQLLDTLAKQYPELHDVLAQGVTVSIDGKLYNNVWSTPIQPDSEVVILPRIVGG